METKVTIMDVAQLAGVSKSTVSRFLNGGSISEEKRERVQRAIEETGFTSNFFARRLKTKRSGLIGVILPRMDSVSVGKLLSGLSRVLEPALYQPLLLVSQLSQEKELANVRRLLQQGVDGIIVDSVGLTPAHYELARSSPVPLLFVGQRGEGVYSIKIDDYGAGRMMGSYLREKGHSHAVFAGVTETDKAVGVERRAGFYEAFTEGREARVDFVETGFHFLSAYDRTAAMLSFGATALVGATDNIALGILRYLHEKKISVPGEVSVVGFGGYEVGAVVYPALTTIAFDYALLGMKAARFILDTLEGREGELTLGMPLFFVERESVRAL